MASNQPKESCCAKAVLHVGAPTGSIKELAGINCYTTSNYSADSTKFVFIFTDIFGLNLVNTKLVADTLSSKLNYPVIIMDILNNDPFVADGSMDFNDWFQNHPVDLTVDICKKFFDNFIKIHKKIDYSAGIGYCFGAKYLSHYLTSNGLLDIGAFAHPSFVSDDELNKISKPLLLSCSEVDEIFTDDLRLQSKKILQKNKIHYQFDLFSNTTHGFSVRGDLTDPLVKYAAEKTIRDQIDWFNFHDPTLNH